MSFDPIFAMAITTLGTTFGVALYQLASVRRALQTQSALARSNRAGRTRS